ncbi:hypothetical protein [Actinoplanes xinjiangensis]|uniref:hypothetical protein n=1 Tax=Actinoplanes xinjiangensis TaxID=512350 RepID=UPI0034253120
MPKSCTSIVLATLLLAGLAGCGGDSPDSTPSSPATSAPASPVVTSAAAPSATAPSSSTPTAASSSAAAFPLTISRRGGFAGVDDRAEIAADGSATVTTGDRPAARVTVPAATVDELRRLVTTPEFSGKAALPEAPACNDGFEYEVATPSSSVTVHECGQPHGAPIDRLLAIAAQLLKN